MIIAHNCGHSVYGEAFLGISQGGGGAFTSLFCLNQMHVLY